MTSDDTLFRRRLVKIRQFVKTLISDTNIHMYTYIYIYMITMMQYPVKKYLRANLVKTF